MPRFIYDLFLLVAMLLTFSTITTSATTHVVLNFPVIQMGVSNFTNFTGGVVSENSSVPQTTPVRSLRPQQHNISEVLLTSNSTKSISSSPLCFHKCIPDGIMEDESRCLVLHSMVSVDPSTDRDSPKNKSEMPSFFLSTTTTVLLSTNDTGFGSVEEMESQPRQQHGTMETLMLPDTSSHAYFSNVESSTCEVSMEYYDALAAMSKPTYSLSTNMLEDAATDSKLSTCEISMEYYDLLATSSTPNSPLSTNVLEDAATNKSSTCVVSMEYYDLLATSGKPVVNTHLVLMEPITRAVAFVVLQWKQDKGIIGVLLLSMELPSPFFCAIIIVFCWVVLTRYNRRCNLSQRRQRSIRYWLDSQRLQRWLNSLSPMHYDFALYLHHDYKVIDNVGEGASGCVFRAYSRQLTSDVAVKYIRRDGSDLNIQRELHFLGLLHGKTGILQYHDVVRAKYGTFIITKFYEGQNFHDFSVQYGCFNDTDLRVVAHKLLEAVDQMHSLQLVHRDIKPGNILCTYDSHGNVDVVLIDFGHCASLQDSSSGKIWGSCGTPGFVAPEAMDESSIFYERGYDCSADMYSIGCTLYYLSQRCVYRGSFPNRWDGMDADFVRFLKRLTHPCPAARMTAQEALAHSWLVGC